jgi:hypothetical protein
MGDAVDASSVGFCSNVEEAEDEDEEGPACSLPFLIFCGRFVGRCPNVPLRPAAVPIPEPTDENDIDMLSSAECNHPVPSSSLSDAKS